MLPEPDPPQAETPKGSDAEEAQIPAAEVETSVVGGFNGEVLDARLGKAFDEHLLEAFVRIDGVAQEDVALAERGAGEDALRRDAAADFEADGVEAGDEGGKAAAEAGADGGEGDALPDGEEGEDGAEELFGEGSEAVLSRVILLLHINAAADHRRLTRTLAVVGHQEEGKGVGSKNRRRPRLLFIGNNDD